MTVAKMERRRSWWLPAGAASPGTRAEMLLRLSLWEGGGTELYFGLSVARASARRLRCERRLLGAGLGSARGSGTFPAPAESQGTRGARHFPSAAFGQIFRGLAKKKSVSLIPGCSAKFWRLLQAVELYRRFLRVLKAELMCSLGREVGAAPACSNVASACYWGAGHSQPCRESWQQAGAGRGRRVGGGGEDAGARRLSWGSRTAAQRWSACTK